MEHSGSTGPRSSSGVCLAGEGLTSTWLRDCLGTLVLSVVSASPLATPTHSVLPGSPPSVLAFFCPRPCSSTLFTPDPPSPSLLSLQACGQIAKWPCSSTGPWPWQVSLDTAGTTLGLQRGHESHLCSVCRWNPLLPFCQWGDPDSRER